MLRLFVGALCGLMVWTAAALGFEIGATIKKVDPEKGVVIAFANGQDRTLKVAADAKFVDAQGKDLAGGLKAKEIKEGAEVTLTVERNGDGPVLKGIRLGRKADNGKQAAAGRQAPAGKTSVGLKPLTEMTAQDKYKGEDGGLYGAGQNDPPEPLRTAAQKETAKIVPLDAEGKPSKTGQIALVSISMSNATQEFSFFKRIADADSQKSPLLTIVDCAQGGQAMAQWTDPRARAWVETDRRLQAAHVSPNQVQVVWVKLANVRPTGELSAHGKKLQSDTLTVLNNARTRFPNLRIAYLGSRIYAGYAGTELNPEPYAYESAFVVRWLIQDQMKGDARLNYDRERGPVKSPVLLWGPYFWGDGVTPRKSDGLVWERKDLAGDGTHPSDSGREKVAKMLLTFFKTDSMAKTWFVKKSGETEK